jgi:hypothetical protein
MRQLPQPTPQPVPKRVARGAYWRLLALVFRWGKVPFSRAISRLEPRAEWPGHDAHWATLEDYAWWLPRHVRWKPDRLGGILDAFPTRETIAAQFRDKGYFEEDCDGLAYFSGQNLIQFVEDPNKITLVTVVLDPYSFDENPLLYAAHVIVVFEYEGKWRVISNDMLYPDEFDSFAEAVQFNPYCEGHPVLWVEVRARDLHLYASGSDLLEVERKMQDVWRKKEQMPHLI